VDGEPKVFVDPIAGRLVEAAAPGTIDAFLAGESAPQLTSNRAGFVLRSRFAEEELARAVARGVRQYVILGAGLDTFPYRQPAFARDLRIFEVDHPATQAWKQDTLAVAGIAIPSNLNWAPVDFERETLVDALMAAGFDATPPSFFSWLGVVPYLTLPAIDATLRSIASLPHPTTVVFNFQIPLEDAEESDELTFIRLAGQRNAAGGEPWLTRLRPAELQSRLHQLGFAQVFHLTPEEADARYFAGREDGMYAGRVSQLISATV
jgi:methyltransferase (TIGR00027 family)